MDYIFTKKLVLEKWSIFNLETYIASVDCEIVCDRLCICVYMCVCKLRIIVK
jgi:hypothetical protein